MEPLQEILSCLEGSRELDIVKEYKSEIGGQNRHFFLVAALREFHVDGLNRLLGEVAAGCSFEVEVSPFSEDLSGFRYGNLRFCLNDGDRKIQYFFGFYPDRKTAEEIVFRGDRIPKK